MAEAVFAGEKVEKLSLQQISATFAFLFAPLARLAEDFFEHDRARDARDGDREDQQPEDLFGDALHARLSRCVISCAGDGGEASFFGEAVHADISGREDERDGSWAIV
jgi:hypothetical protein